MEQTTRTHRVGAVTAGLSMIIFGALFLLHIFMGLVSYEMIFGFWPVIIIGLGIELLISNFLTDKLVYDKAAIFLMFITTFFAMGMAFMNMAYDYLAKCGCIVS